MPVTGSSQKLLYEQAADSFGDALSRLARAYESDAEKRRDLQQEIHLALWRSFAGFDERCSLRTWIYRVAHNAAASHVIRQARSNARTFVSLDDVDIAADFVPAESELDRRQHLDRLLGLIRELKPIDRQVMVSHLEDLDAASIAEITGLTAINVSTKIHRIKHILAERFQKGARHAE